MMVKLVRLGGVLTGTVVTTTLAVLLVANPDRRDYERYAASQLTDYLKNGVCDKARSSPDLQGGLRGYCKALVDTGRPFLQDVISTGTIRRNFLIFSVYQTEIGLPAPLPSYQFSTIAVLTKFFTYEALEI
jgi:hypothetical protein